MKNLFKVEEFIVQVLSLISCEVDGEIWGIWYDILWCSQFVSDNIFKIGISPCGQITFLCFKFTFSHQKISLVDNFASNSTFRARKMLLLEGERTLQVDTTLSF